MVLLWHASAVALALITATSFAAIVSQKHPPPPTRASFRHPGLLHSAEDFTRVTTMVNAHAQPWYAGWQKLLSNGHAQSMYVPNPQPTVYRGSDGVHPQNYGVLYNDVAAAYQNALRWKISGNEDHAKAAIKILDAWSSTLLEVTGNSDRFLAYGFYGYQFANAAEIMRDYSGWPRASFQAFVDMLQTKFQYWSYIFLYGDPTHASHNGQAIDHYWANWDLCNIALGLSLGVLSDNSTMYEQTIHYFKTGAGNGAIQKALWKLYDNVDGQTLAQYQESGRDQGHSLMGIGLLGVIAQIAYNQGDDLFSYLDSRILAGSEYTTKYNLGNNVPYTTYDNSNNANQTIVSSSSRGNNIPVFELLYNHYGKVANANVKYTQQYRNRVVNASGGAEGGGGDYAGNSGGYDFLGFGTLMYTR